MTLKELQSEMTEIKQVLVSIADLLKGGSFGVGAAVAPCSYTLFSWLDEWYNTYKKPALKESSLKSIKICIDKHIKPHIQDKSLNEIIGLDVQKALNEISSSRMRKYTYDVYGAAFKQACRSKLIRENPLDSVDNVKHERKTGNALTEKQINNLLHLLDGHRLKPLYLFYILTGCRRQEGLDLRWSDIDFKAGQIHIRGTKTKGSDRKIPLSPMVAKLLRTVRRDSDFVFPYSANLVHQHFRRLKTLYKLPYRIHDLRHTFATQCLQSGINMKLVQKWLGHSKIDTTLNTYTHVQTDFEDEEIKKFCPKIDL